MPRSGARRLLRRRRASVRCTSQMRAEQDGSSVRDLIDLTGHVLVLFATMPSADRRVRGGAEALLLASS